MIKAPDAASVHAAELKLFAARERTINGGRRTWRAMRTALARPSSLALVAAAGFCGGLVVSRPRARRASSSTDKGNATSFAAMALAFAMRYASRILPVVIARVWTERKAMESTAPCAVVQTTVIHDGSAR